MELPIVAPVYKIINNLAQVPHEHILTKAYEGTRQALL